ncbi:MAG: DNA gyrase subunit A [Candidatus Nitronauta litoralis]|uniref:DNA gyrase subunit A n=1 Tax=Candidatus Nitronauta litoralis TaxID=2705533 RepID=A0A7T0BUZ6_9BACT|nr:MAG: DNA gyrase subunit A [Candidatus Nitronauta litoralis]
MSELIEGINIEDEMRSSYLDYAMSVIIGRALPDIRDGLKPVHRRTLYAMHEESNTFNRPYKKSAQIVGAVMGRYHPHGDSAIYDTIVRMAQDFSLRQPLVDGQGNFGSVDGDSAAASRYTEIRMAEISQEMLRDLEKETVQFQPTYDGSRNEPTVLPAGFPQLLVNGASGIAVGMATNIPPHNLKEVVSATIKLIDQPDATVPDLMEEMTGPDFPTSGIIQGTNGIRSAYHTGRGQIRVRARVDIETNEKTDRETIIVRELPYQVNKARQVERIAQLVRDKKLEGISDLRDESDRDGIRIVIELKKGANSQVILNTLYKNTQLQETFGIIMLAIVNRQPRVLNLKEALQYFITFRREVVTRRTEFDLKKAREKEHILEGLKIALDNLDDVVRTIREAEDPASAKESLMSNFGLSEIQSKAILEMRLQRLTGLERQKILDDLAAVREEIKQYEHILANEDVKLAIIREELTVIRDKYGSERRTEIVEDDEGDIDIEDMIADEDMVITFSRSGYIKRLAVDNYRSQKRGGKGVKGMAVREEDVVSQMFVASTKDYLLIFTNIGKVHWLKVYRVPEATRVAKGKSIANLLQLQPDEKIASILPVKTFEEDKFVVCATQRGVVKKTSLMAYSNVRQGGIIGLTLDDGDRVIAAEVSDGSKDVILATRLGKAIRFQESDVRAMGRTARGVVGIRFKEDDAVVSAVIVEPGNSALTVTENGYGKRTPVEDYPVQGRGGQGVITMKTNDKTGSVVGVEQVTENDELLVVTSNGNIIRMPVDGISTMGRNTQGVRLARIQEGNHVVAVEKFVE